MADMESLGDASGASDARLIAVRLHALHNELVDMKAAMREMSSAIIRLALIEERQAQYALNLERVAASLEALQGRLSTLERAQPLNDAQVKHTSKWVDRLAWSAIGLVVMYVLKKVGLIG